MAKKPEGRMNLCGACGTPTLTLVETMEPDINSFALRADGSYDQDDYDQHNDGNVYGRRIECSKCGLDHTKSHLQYVRSDDELADLTWELQHGKTS